MTISYRDPLPGRWWPALFRIACLACCTAAAGAAEPAQREFNLPADTAEQSLKRFSMQAGIEVVFATHATEGVRTAALQGQFAPMEALQRLLAGTPLFARPDERSGAIVVSRGKVPDPNGQRAAPKTASDRPINRKPLTLSNHQTR